MCPAAASPPLASRLKDRERRPKYFFTPAMDDEIRDAYHLYVEYNSRKAIGTLRTEAWASQVDGHAAWRHSRFGASKGASMECRRSGSARAVGAPH